MSKHDDLVKKLKEIFQIDRPELDFGVYRILNARVVEISDYLENRLKAKVGESLVASGAANVEGVQKELKEKEAQYLADGIDPETVPKVRELRQKLADYSVGASEHENAVFTHLLTFFSRYYDSGDFISQRRYKGDTYAIPYAGEEVVLHWANKDQYYTKSGENFSNYAFKLDDGRSVRFRLVTADTAKDNRKDNDKERRFVLIEPITRTLSDDEGNDYEETWLPVAEENGELVLRFEYKAMPKGTKQDALVVDATNQVLADPIVKARWLDLNKREPTEKNPQRTLLEKTLTSYTAKNSADYFIHKDLGCFLRRELDFYIKNEVMNLDDVQHAEKFADIEKNLRLIQTLRAIALDLIAFLAQLEDFQKKLWLKKKFVVSTHYGITLDRVPESLYSVIAANPLQWEQWENLGMLNGKVDLINQAEVGSVDYLKEHPYLMADTALFDVSFKYALLAAVDNLDDSLDGLLIHGDNFQALNLLQERYREQVKCIYIDPPYNTGNDGFPYKDGFQKSSWITMMQNRAELANTLMSNEALFFQQIGDEESARSMLLFESVFAQRKNSVVVRRGIKNVQAQFEDIEKLNQGHDIIHIFAKNSKIRVPHLVQEFGIDKSGKWDTFWRGTDRPTMRYELFGINPESGQWRWESGRANKAAKDYQEYLEKVAPLGKTLDEWYVENIQAGVELNFVRLNEQNVVQYYIAPQSGRLISDNWLDIPASGSFTDFAHEKGLALLSRVFGWNTNEGDILLDYFAGSGSSGHAAIRALKSKRKYILVEQGDYFDTVLKPRIQKVAYSADWKDGKATAPHTGISHAFKVLKIESYEDTLNNLQLRRTKPQQDLLDTLPESAQEDYLLRYLLDIESRGSLLSVEQFNQPFNCKLKVTVDSAGAYEERTIDLVETFNYLIGLRVKHIDVQRDKGFVLVTGWLPTGEKTLVLWRDISQVDYEALNRLCDKLAINPADSEFDIVYINGDHNIPAVFTSLETEGGITKTLKIRQIEPEFLSRMFAVEGV
ncbi:MAG: site-specific DNA-methyltransferase [Methylovulum sp.]|nr:site-specific DNA-methyltransferase [Methylovulum sp.]